MNVKFNWVSKELGDATVHVAHTPYGDLSITEDKGVPWLHMCLVFTFLLGMFNFL